MAEPIMTAAELISFLEGQCKQSDSDRDDWKLMTERLQRVIKHHENVGAELRASIAQLETHNAALSGGWKALECELAESSRVLKQTNSALNSQQNESRRLEAEIHRLCNVDTENKGLECAADTDSAEIARLKDEIDGLVDDHNTKDFNIAEMRAQVDLLKSAVRWLVSNHAGREGPRALVCISANGSFAYSGGADKDIPREFAAVIAEALEKSDD